MTEFKLPVFGTQVVYLKGVNTNLKPGDALLFIGEEREKDPGNENWDFRRVKTVITDPEKDYTVINLDQHLGSTYPYKVPAKNPKVYALRQRATLFGYNAPDWRTMSDPVKSGCLKEGLYAEYFQGVDLIDRRVKRVDPEANFDWGTGSPSPAIGADNFSARWTGLVKSDFSGIHTFYTISDDGVRLWVNHQLIINNWTDHSEKEDRGTIRLDAGRLYEIRLEYYERGGVAKIKLLWERPGHLREVLPESRLYHHAYTYDEWPNFNIAYSATVPPNIDTIYLDSLYPKILPGSWLVLTTPDWAEVYEVDAITGDSQTNFTLTSKTSRLQLKGEKLGEKFGDRLRETVVYAESERLELAEEPIVVPLYGEKIALSQLSPDLKPGQALAVSGKLARVKIADTAQNLQLVSTDDSKIITLQPGDSLWLMSPTVLSSTGALLTPEELFEKLTSPSLQQLKWHLMDRDGFIGFLTAVSDMVIFHPALKGDPKVNEIAFINDAPDAVSSDRERTTIKLRESLQNIYDRETVTINANVARATHGETVQEVLGSGDASQPFQKFTLKQPPLTHISASTPSGAESTLKVRVNDILWQEMASLYGRGSRDRVYITKTDDDGKTTVQFGDGITGTRLPTGQNNIQVTYRKGIGIEGNVKAEQLTMLLTRPLGVKGVTNPLAATGGDDRESLADARHNAPLTVLTLERAVSLKDYEDFARAFAGISKALATWVWDGKGYNVFITVAGPKGVAIEEKSQIYENLLTALQKSGDPFVKISIKSYKKTFFKIAGNIKISSGYQPEKVLKSVKKELRTRFSFDARDFGQPVMLSEVIAVIQAVQGVVMVDVDKLYRVGESEILNHRLTAGLPKMGENGEMIAAELLMLDPAPIELGVVS